MKTHTFKHTNVWKFKYTNTNGQPDAMITMDRARLEEWSGRRDGIIVQLYELVDDSQVPVLCKPKEGCEEV